MTILSIHLRDGFYERKINFTKGRNLVISRKNSCGKTTLLRFILYALGYSIPSTQSIKFSNCQVTLEVNCENFGLISLTRDNELSIEMNFKDEKQTFVLPEQRNDLHKILFSTENIDILNNILGTFYVDQEKGWTLLNRGIVIGRIRLSVEELIRGMANVDCRELIEKEKKVQIAIQKYQNILSISQYRDEILSSGETLVFNSYEEESEIIENQLLIEQKNLTTELKRIDKTLSENKKFKKFVADMKLFVESPDGLSFQVTESNIVGLTDTINILILKRKQVSEQLSTIHNDLIKLEKIKSSDENQLSFLDSISEIEIFDKKLAKIPMNQKLIKKNIDNLKKELKSIQSEIKDKTMKNKTVISYLSKKLLGYLKELDLTEHKMSQENYLFTSNLKELSGAVLHKTAFAFRLAYISAIENTLNIKLPIILDSPSGKEVDKNNVAIMLKLVERDFAEHQVIIASIFNYDISDLNEIEINNKLIDQTIIN